MYVYESTHNINFDINKEISEDGNILVLVSTYLLIFMYIIQTAMPYEKRYSILGWMVDLRIYFPFGSLRIM